MIRMLEDADIPFCLQIYNWYILHSSATFETKPLALEEFTDRVHVIQKKYPWIVLEEDEMIMGYAYLDAFHERIAYSWTCDLSIYLDHQQKGKGYGKQLMKSILKLAKEDGYHNVVSIITEGNQASEAIHRSFGFEKKVCFEKFGYKNLHWLGVSYYVKKLKDGVNGVDLSAPKNETV